MVHSQRNPISREVAERGGYPRADEAGREELELDEAARQSKKSSSRRNPKERFRKDVVELRQVPEDTDKKSVCALAGSKMSTRAGTSIQLDKAEELEVLVELFGGSTSIDEILSAYLECDGSTETAADLLLNQSTARHSQQTQVAGPGTSLAFCKKHALEGQAASDRGRTDFSASQKGIEEEEEHEELWETLPEECKQLILDRLTHRDRARAALVSREFSRAVRALREGIKSLVLPPNMSPASLCSMVAAHTNLERLSFQRCRKVVKSVQPVLAAAAGGECRRSLLSVNLDGCALITDAALSALARHCARPAGDAAQSDGSESLGDSADLTSLAEAGAASRRGRGHGKSKYVSLEYLPGSMHPIHLHFENHRTRVSPFEDHNGQEKHQQQQQQQQQEEEEEDVGMSVNVSSCPAITDAGVKNLLEAPLLTSLHISGNPQLTAGALRLPVRSGLRHLTAHGLAALTLLTLMLPRNSPMETLSLTGCSNLESATVHVAGLRDLRLGSCTRLHTLSLHCPSLATLLLPHCSSLRSLSHIKCPALRVLSIFMCRQLSAQHVGALLAQALGLEDLDASGCLELQSLVLPAPTLSSLSLAGCSRLRRVEIISAVMEELNCNRCTALQHLRCPSSSLRRLQLSNTPSLSILLLPFGALSAAAKASQHGGCLELSINNTSLPAPTLLDLERLSSGSAC
eukprot:jgi/Mesen1/8871/ME000530S08287